MYLPVSCWKARSSQRDAKKVAQLSKQYTQVHETQATGTVLDAKPSTVGDVTSSVSDISETIKTHVRQITMLRARDSSRIIVNSVCVFMCGSFLKFKITIFHSYYKMEKEI